jgi:uncharacterized protein YbjT (DUF2867 family)
VTIYGGSGFVGRYIVRRMAKAGWRVRVAVRRPNEAIFVRPYGAVGQVEPVFCNIRDDASVQAAMQGADAVVNCVGILAESGKSTFEAIQADGAERIARIAAAEGISRMVQISAIGANADSASEYAQTKAMGESAVLKHMPAAVILRPSIVFGPEDHFFNRFAGMTRLSPAVPVIGADTLFQPVYVDDVAHAAEMAVVGDAPAKILALAFDVLEAITFGLIKNGMVTRDQVKNLGTDNVVAQDAKGFDALGISPVSMASVLPDYLWRFRPSGQYDDIMASAKNLRS